MLSLIGLISLLSFVTCLIMGIIVYFKEVKYVFNNKLGKIFVFLCIALAFCWAIIEFGYRNANDYNTAYNWLKINVAWYIVISFLLHLTLIYSENIKLLRKKTTHLLIYGPAFFFILIDITTNLLVTKPIKESWGWTFGIPSNPVIHTISTTWAAFTAFFCLYIILEYSSKIKNPYKKKKVKFAIVGMSIPIMIGFNTEWLFPLLKIKAPELLVPALTLGLFIIWYGTWIYNPKQIDKNYTLIRKDIDKIINSG